MNKSISFLDQALLYILRESILSRLAAIEIDSLFAEIFKHTYECRIWKIFARIRILFHENEEFLW